MLAFSIQKDAKKTKEDFSFDNMVMKDWGRVRKRQYLIQSFLPRLEVSSATWPSDSSKKSQIQEGMKFFFTNYSDDLDRSLETNDWKNLSTSLCLFKNHWKHPPLDQWPFCITLQIQVHEIYQIYETLALSWCYDMLAWFESALGYYENEFYYKYKLQLFRKLNASFRLRWQLIFTIMAE